MKSGRHDICIEKGATFKLNLTWKDENETVYNLTGYTARMQIRETVDSASFIIELTNANNRIALGGALGTITLTITATDTMTITQNSGVYDLEIVSASGEVTRLLEGNVSITNEVTR